MLSAVIVAWNEERVLERCLSSINNLVDEIVVIIDNDTTDGTSEVAKKFKAKIFYHDHTGIVEPMRNFAISKAKGEWILLLDADEEVSTELSNNIKEFISVDKSDYARIPRKNIIFGKWIESHHWWPDYVYRLFKKNAITWPENIHSIPETKGRGYDFPPDEKYSLTHHNYQSVSQYVDRINRYSDIQSNELCAKGINFSWTFLIRKPFSEFISQYFSREAYLDGIHGLALSLLQAFSELVVYLKLWQLQKFSQKYIPIDLIHNEIHHAGKDLFWWITEIKIKKKNILLRVLYKINRKIKLL